MGATLVRPQPRADLSVPSQVLTASGKDVVVLEELGLKVIEFFGGASLSAGKDSIAITEAEKAVKEAWQTPLFDEYVYVLSGEAQVWVQPSSSAPLKVFGLRQGQAAFSPAGTRVRWCFSAGTRLLAVCSPCFREELCPREQEGEASSPSIFHVARKERWERAKAEGKTYFPETYDQDGFVHGTANAERLIEVLNTFYTDKPGSFVCLRLSVASIEKANVKLVFEEAMPVGNKEGKALRNGPELFPHLYGGIKIESVLEELPVRRAGGDIAGAKFESIVGLTDTCRSIGRPSVSSLLRTTASVATPSVLRIVVVGAAALALGFALGAMVVRREGDPGDSKKS